MMANAAASQLAREGEEREEDREQEPEHRRQASYGAARGDRAGDEEQPAEDHGRAVHIRRLQRPGRPLAHLVEPHTGQCTRRDPGRDPDRRLRPEQEHHRRKEAAQCSLVGFDEPDQEVEAHRDHDRVVQVVCARFRRGARVRDREEAGHQVPGHHQLGCSESRQLPSAQACSGTEHEEHDGRDRQASVDDPEQLARRHALRHRDERRQHYPRRDHGERIAIDERVGGNREQQGDRHVPTPRRDEKCDDHAAEEGDRGLARHHCALRGARRTRGRDAHADASDNR